MSRPPAFKDQTAGSPFVSPSSSSSHTSSIPHPSASTDPRLRPDIIPAHEYETPSTSDCASAAQESIMLDSDHPTDKALSTAIDGAPSVARPDDESESDSECEAEYEGGVSLLGHDETMDLDASNHIVTDSVETPHQSPSTIFHQQQDHLGSLHSRDRQIEHFFDFTEDFLSREEALVSTEAFTDPFAEHEGCETSPPSPPPGHYIFNNELSGQEALLQDLHGSAGFPNSMDIGAETQIGTATQDQPPISSQHATISNDLWDSISELEYAESIFDEPYPQMLPWYASAASQAYQYDLDFFGPLDQQSNMSLLECLRFWREGHALQQRNPDHHHSKPEHFCRLTDAEIHRGMRARRRDKVTIRDLRQEKCDFQGIDWTMMNVSRREVRNVRRKTYLNLANLITSYPQAQVFNHWQLFSSSPYFNLEGRRGANTDIADTEEYFLFSQMHLRYPVCIPHFQLRHVVSASSKNAVFFLKPGAEEDEPQTTGSHISRMNPELEHNDYVVNSANCCDSDAPKMQKIHTLTAKNGVLVAGGLQGDYAYRTLSAPPGSPFTSGMITLSHCSSTNHVHTFLDRRNGLPQAVFSSNDYHVRTLDCTTNKFTAHHNHVKAVNCTATSPDTRLRLVVRDAKHSLIVEADTGKRVGKLTGHNDFGFACDWADDGIHMATGAQDGIVQIYDMRQWREPIRTLLTELGGVRTLAFSPAAGGKQMLVMAESADFVHVVDGTAFDKKQTFDVFGEIAGVTFEPDGEKFFVGVGDPEVGGLMEFERRQGRGFRAKIRPGNAWERLGQEVDGDERSMLLDRPRKRTGLKSRESLF
ncbi:MAG: hypothetical protein Q9181_007280 [Wetmoreana brouardii]